MNCDRSETLTKYHHILDYCYKYGLDAEQRLHVRTMCAKLCLKLHKYSDAYIQCMECTKLDAKNHEVRINYSENFYTVIMTHHASWSMHAYTIVCKI